MVGVAMAVLGAWAVLNLLRVDHQGRLQVRGWGEWNGTWEGNWRGNWGGGGSIHLDKTHTPTNRPTPTPIHTQTQSTPNHIHTQTQSQSQNLGALWQGLTTLAIVAAVLAYPSPEHRNSARDVFEHLHNGSGFPDRYACFLAYLFPFFGSMCVYVCVIYW